MLRNISGLDTERKICILNEGGMVRESTEHSDVGENGVKYKLKDLSSRTKQGERTGSSFKSVMKSKGSHSTTLSPLGGGK